jgi:hypothetical protein
MVGFDWRSGIYISPPVNLYNSNTFLANKINSEFTKNTIITASESSKRVISSNYYPLLQKVRLASPSTPSSAYYTTPELHS